LAALADNHFDRCTLFRCGVIFYAINAPALISIRTITAGGRPLGRFPACALGHKACRDDRSVLYHRVPRLFDALALARGDGRYARLLKNLARADLLILDDWGLAPLTPEQARDLLEIIDDRHGRGSTIVTS